MFGPWCSGVTSQSHCMAWQLRWTHRQSGIKETQKCKSKLLIAAFLGLHTAHVATMSALEIGYGLLYTCFVGQLGKGIAFKRVLGKNPLIIGMLA